MHEIWHPPVSVIERLAVRCQFFQSRYYKKKVLITGYFSGWAKVLIPIPSRFRDFVHFLGVRARKNVKIWVPADAYYLSGDAWAPQLLRIVMKEPERVTRRRGYLKCILECWCRIMIRNWWFRLWNLAWQNLLRRRTKIGVNGMHNNAIMQMKLQVIILCQQSLQ